jgi:hypothetical protein
MRKRDARAEVAANVERIRLCVKTFVDITLTDNMLLEQLPFDFTHNLHA